MTSRSSQSPKVEVQKRPQFSTDVAAKQDASLPATKLETSQNKISMQLPYLNQTEEL